MPNYTIDDHSLSLTDYYRKLTVKPDNGPSVDYDLEKENKAVQIALENGAYIIQYIDRPTQETWALDTLKSPGFASNGSKVGGGVIIDLRDIEKYGIVADVGPADYEIDLGGTSLTLWYHNSGPRALNMLLDMAYHTITQ